MQIREKFDIDESSSKDSLRMEIFSTEGELKHSDIQLRLIMHHGIPTTCCLFAYDPMQHMLAMATKDGHIKIFTDSGMEHILQLSKQSAIQFLQFFNNQCLLVSVNVENVIEVWDTSTLSLVGSQKWNINITALGVIQNSTYFFIGDESGTVNVMQYIHEQLAVNSTPYSITLPQVFGEDNSEILSVKHVLPQPGGEHERVLICYVNGVCALWALHDGEVIAVRAHMASTLEPFSELEQGENSAKQLPDGNATETKKLTSVCWSCRNGLKFATGYSDGDIWIWSIDQTLETLLVSATVRNDNFNCSSTPLCKLKIGSVVPVNALRWWEKGDCKQEKEGFLCALGGKTVAANDVLKVISVSDACLSKSKYSAELEVPEKLVDCIPVYRMTWSIPEAKFLIMVLGSQGNLYAYNVKEIFQSFKDPVQSDASSISRPFLVDFSLSKSKVTMTKLIFLRKNGRVFDFMMQIPRVFKPRLSYQFLEQAEYLSDLESDGSFLYLTGHEDGLVYFWDLSTQIMSVCCPQFQENEDDKIVLSMGDSPVSYLDFCYNSGLLAVGFANGSISLHILNLDNHKSEKARQAEKVKGQGALWSCVSKFHTHKVPICCISISSSQHRVASGCENGVISLFDIETKTTIYSGSCFHNKFSRIMSLNFVSIPTLHTNVSCCGAPVPSCSKNKSIVFLSTQRVLVTTKDSGVSVLDAETGAILKTSPLKLKDPGNVISLHVLDVSGPSLVMPEIKEPEKVLTSKTVPKAQNTKPVESIHGDASTRSRQYLLLCSENALRVYSMPPSFKDVCSSFIKVKLNSPCQWASTFQTPNKRNGLALLYKTGKMELRCLPSLNLLKSIPPGCFLNWKIEPTPSSLKLISCTSNGRIALVKSNGELLVWSFLNQKHDLRCSKLHPSSPKAVKKMTETTMDFSLNKKKTLRKVINTKNVLLRISDKGSKLTSQKAVDLDLLFTGKSASISSLQSSQNLNDESYSEGSSCMDMSSKSLDIDDIEIDDEDPSKDGSITSNHRKFLSKVKRNMKGKEKVRKLDSNKISPRQGEVKNQVQKSDEELSPVLGPRTINEIKAAYKPGKDHSVMGTASGIRDKLIQQRHKLGEIQKKTTDMQDGAQQFHKMAEELYRAIEEKNKRKFF